MPKKEVGPIVAIVAIVAVLVIAVAVYWKNYSPPATPVVDPNNPLPGLGKPTDTAAQKGAGRMGPSPNAAERMKQQQQFQGRGGL